MEPTTEPLPTPIPSRPRVAVYALIDGPTGHILLGRNTRDAHRGKWELPGGGVEFGETLEEAAIREVREETGLIVSVQGPVLPFQLIGPAYHTVALVLRARARGGEVKAADDLDEVRWFTRAELLLDIMRPAEDSALSAPARMYLQTMYGHTPVVRLG